METEKENKLSFLDVEIILEQGKFTTAFYRKPTFSGVYSNFELISLKGKIQKNTYTENFVDKCFKTHLVKENVPTVEKKRVCSLPFHT